jgi:hypothetical protein
MTVVLGIIAGGATTWQTLEGIDKGGDKSLSGDTIDEVLENITPYVINTFDKVDEFNTALADDGFGKVASLMDGNQVLLRAPTWDFMNSTLENVRDDIEGGD